MQVNQKAPVLQSFEMFIQASPERVWAVLTGINQWTSWHPKITRAALRGDLKPGSKFDWKIKGASIHSTLHTVEATRAFGWSGVTFGGSAIHNWNLESQQGGTLVTVEESMEGWLVALFKNKMNRDLAADMRYWMEKMKIECEKI